RRSCRAVFLDSASNEALRFCNAAPLAQLNKKPVGLRSPFVIICALWPSRLAGREPRLQLLVERCRQVAPFLWRAIRRAFIYLFTTCHLAGGALLQHAYPSTIDRQALPGLCRKKPSNIDGHP